MNCPPEGDLTSSSETGRSQENASTHSNTPHFPGQAQDDLLLSQSDQSLPQFSTMQGQADGSAGPQNNFAEATYDGQVFRDEAIRYHGPEVERQAFDDNRPLHVMHIGTVSSRPKQLKQLLQDLLIQVNLSDAEKRVVDELAFRKDKINKVLEFWRVKESPGIRRTSKTVKDLVELLQQAGGQEEKYNDLLEQLRRCPP